MPQYLLPSIHSRLSPIPLKYEVQNVTKVLGEQFRGGGGDTAVSVPPLPMALPHTSSKNHVLPLAQVP
jgi:hypothetical protein